MQYHRACVLAFWAVGVFATAVAAQDPPTSSVKPERSRIDLADPVRLKAGNEVIDTVGSIGHAGPMLHDIDGDGIQDLIVGNFIGNFQIYRNTGSSREPVFESRGLLKADGETAKIHNW